MLIVNKNTIQELSMIIMIKKLSKNCSEKVVNIEKIDIMFLDRYFRHAEPGVCSDAGRCEISTIGFYTALQRCGAMEVQYGRNL